MFRRPTPGFLAGFLVTLGCLLALGAWQAEKAPRKAAMMATMAERVTAPAISLQETLRDPEAARYRRIVLRGGFRHHQEMFTGAPKHRGAVGRDLVVPFDLDGGIAAPSGAVLVVRGWVPLNTLAGLERPEAPVTVAGHVMLPGKPAGWASLLIPNDRPASRYWLRVDIDTMARAAGIADPLPFYVLAAPGADATIPIGRAPEIIADNPHWSYAATWFGLAVVLAAMFALFHLKRNDPASRAD